jgi:hypothetical protein
LKHICRFCLRNEMPDIPITKRMTTNRVSFFWPLFGSNAECEVRGETKTAKILE